MRGDLWRPSGPTPTLKPGHQEQVAQDLVRAAVKGLPGGSLHSLSCNLLRCSDDTVTRQISRNIENDLQKCVNILNREFLRQVLLKRNCLLEISVNYK